MLKSSPARNVSLKPVRAARCDICGLAIPFQHMRDRLKDDCVCIDIAIGFTWFSGPLVDAGCKAIRGFRLVSYYGEQPVAKGMVFIR